MADEPAKSHFGARFRGALYAFLHATVRRSIFGATIRGWLVNGSLFLALFLALLGSPIVWPILIAVLAILLRLLYWKARRDGYVHFIAGGAQQPDNSAPAIVDNKKVPIKATGIFSTKNWQEYVLAKPADYWRVPMGDHAIMVQYVPGRYLYQFVRLGAVETLEAGLIYHGAKPKNALAITYLTSWGPNTDDVDFMFYAPSDDDNPAQKQQRIYLAFEDQQARDSVWQGFLGDGQQKKIEVS